MDFSKIKGFTIPEGVVTKIMRKSDGIVLWSVGGLPSVYQEVEWIGTDGKQYIDTGVMASNYQEGIGYSLDFMITSWNDSAGQRSFFGAYANGSYSGNLSIDAYAGNYHFNVGSTTKTVYRWVSTLNQIATLKTFATSLNVQGSTVSLLVDGVEQLKTYTALSASNTPMPTANIYLFRRSGEDFAGPIMRAYSFTMDTSDGTPIRNFIPCYRKSDGVIGMYDTVGKKFYTNEGTGSFTKGADVTQ